MDIEQLPFQNKNEYLSVLSTYIDQLQLFTFNSDVAFTSRFSKSTNSITFEEAGRDKFSEISPEKFYLIMLQVILNESFIRKDIIGTKLFLKYSLQLVEFLLPIFNIDISTFASPGSKSKVQVASHYPISTELEFKRKLETMCNPDIINPRKIRSELGLNTKSYSDKDFDFGPVSNEISHDNIRRKLATGVLDFKETDKKGTEVSEVEIFYATNRKNSEKKKEIFSAESSEALKYGKANISIPENHISSKFERPSFWKFEFKENAKKHITLANNESLSETDFYDFLSVKEKNSACIFVHGYNVKFRHALLKAGQLKFDLDLKIPFILFSWPSHGEVSKYPNDQRNSENSAIHLTQVIESLNAKGITDIYLIAHSMGGLCTSMALSYLKENNLTCNNLILAAPDVCRVGFKQRYYKPLKDICENITLYASSTDIALKLSKKFDGSPKLGSVTPEIPIYNHMDTIDSSGLNSDFMRHSFYSSSNCVLTDIYHLIHNNLPPNKRRLKQVSIKPSEVYWKFKTT